MKGKKSPRTLFWAQRQQQRIKSSLFAVVLVGIVVVQLSLAPFREFKKSPAPPTTTQAADGPVPTSNAVSQSRRSAEITPTDGTKWKRYSSNAIDLPYPIFVTSLPKSGTTSVWKYFKCGGQLASHNWIKKPWDRASSLAGRCIQDNVHNNRPPFKGCGAYDVFTDTGYIEYDHETGLECYFPSVDGLEEIYQSYPHATFLNVVRDSQAWYQSLQSWAHGSLFVRFRMCNATGFPNGQARKEEFLQFYENQNERIRQFARERPSLTYVEVKLEAAETGRIISELTGIEEKCWKKCKPDEAECEGDSAGASRQRKKRPTRKRGRNKIVF